MENFFKRLFNNRGSNEGEAEGKAADKKGAEGSKGAEGTGKTYSEGDVERIVQDRLNRDRRDKYLDYEDLKKKANEFDKHLEKSNQQELEAKKEYEKLKEGWAKKEGEYQTLLNQTKAEVQSERVSNALNQQILQKNAYPEAAQLLKAATKYHEDGTITIRGKDANGMETDLPIDKGVEQFLKDRPYLVKGSAKGGAGTGNAGDVGTSSTDQNLSQQLQNAMAVGDRKSINDIKARIRAKHAGGGTVQII